MKNTSIKNTSDTRKKDANKFLEDILGESVDSDEDSPVGNNESDDSSGTDDI
jgi:hypothetical protein